MNLAEYVSKKVKEHKLEISLNNYFIMKGIIKN